jgi:hypothetical protein
VGVYEYPIMKMLYSNENNFLVNNIKNIIESHDINTFIKNEFAQGAIGEISAIDSWPELWITDDDDFDRAMEILETSQKTLAEDDWCCINCSEKNDPSFEICWNCQFGKSK